MSAGGYASVSEDLLRFAADCGDFGVAELILASGPTKVISISPQNWGVVFAIAFQRNSIRLLELLLDAPCARLIPQWPRGAWPPIQPACEVNRVAPALELKERDEAAKWLEDFLLPEPCIVHVLRPTYIYWALFRPVSNMANTPEALALLGQRTRVSLQHVVHRGADINAVATLRCLCIADGTTRYETTTVLGLCCRKQRFIKAQGQENLKPLLEYLQAIGDMLLDLGASEFPTPAPTSPGSWLVTNHLPGAGRSSPVLSLRV
jgi:hypothetical protein